MLKVAFVFISILIITHSCYPQSDTKNSSDKFSRSLEVVAKDLSEDGTRMSSHNDELLVLIYDISDISHVLNAPVFSSLFVLDTSDRVKVLSDVSFSKGEYMIFLIELDDERPVKQIDPVIRVYSNEILQLFDQKKFSSLSDYFGDNDLLGYIRLDLQKKETPFESEIKGRQALDSYDYKLKFY